MRANSQSGSISGRVPTTPRQAARVPALPDELDLNLLRAFEALVLDRSVSRAAQRLCVTQSGMSRALGRLREHFRDPLFLRTGGHLTATPLAESLSGPIGRVLETVRTGLLSSVRFDPFLTPRTFTVAMADYCEAALLSAMAKHMGGEAHQVRCVPTLHDDGERLLRGELDLAIALRPQRGGLVTRRLLRDPFVVVLHRDHPAARDGSLTLERYLALGHVVVAPHDRPGNPVDGGLAGMGRRRAIRARVHSALATRDLLLATDFVATLPHLVASQIASRFPLRLVSPPLDLPAFDLALIWPQRLNADPGHRWLRQALVDAARALDRCRRRDDGDSAHIEYDGPACPIAAADP